MAKKAVLIRRRNKRGRPRKDEKVAKLTTFPVFVCRDPQGIKLFPSKPSMVAGLWQGALLDNCRVVDPKQFVAKFRNAKLPLRDQLLEMEMAK